MLSLNNILHSKNLDTATYTIIFSDFLQFLIVHTCALVKDLYDLKGNHKLVT